MFCNSYDKAIAVNNLVIMSNESSSNGLAKSSPSSSSSLNANNKKTKTTSNNMNATSANNNSKQQSSNAASKQSKSMTSYNILSAKNTLICDITRAIQLVQKAYLEKETGNQPLTNSDYQVHELCQQFDYAFLFGLKNQEESYWKVVLEFTHSNVVTDLNRLLNVTTNFGKSRAWIYHALNDNLMESYLKCILDNRKLIERHYKKDASLMSDEQAITVLFTLVAGLENVEFKLYNDVPYLDHSCWPAHLTMKRQVVDAIINSSPQSLSQLVDLSSSLNESLINPANQSSFNLLRSDKSLTQKALNNGEVSNLNSDSTATALNSNNSSLLIQTRKQRMVNTKRNTKKSVRAAPNNISLDDNSSNGSLSDLNSNLNDESSETSGRFTAASNILQNTSPNQSSNDFNVNSLNEEKKSSKNTLSSLNKKLKHRKEKMLNIKKNENDNDGDEDSGEEVESFDNEDSLNSSSSVVMEKMVGLSVKTTSTTNTLVYQTSKAKLKATSKNTDSSLDLDQDSIDNNLDDQQDKKIDNEINKLSLMISSNNSTKQQSGLEIVNKKKLKTIRQQSSSSLASSFNNSSSAAILNQELAASSLKASNHFDNKIKHIENYSQIIEKATLKMDACVQDMNIVYENYDKLCEGSPSHGFLSTDESIDPVSKQNNFSVYDVYNTTANNENSDDVYGNTNTNNYNEEKSNVDQSSQLEETNVNIVNDKERELSISSIKSNQTTNNFDTVSFKNERDFDKDSLQTSISTNKMNEPQNYLDCVLDVNDLKQEIKVDNNLKLMLMIEIFQNGQNEEFVKFYHASIGHNQGEIEPISLLITSHGVYILKRKETSDDSPSATSNSYKNLSPKFVKQAFINHNQMDYIEVSMCDQAIHFVCINKRQNCWITIASRKLTENILDNLQLARELNKSLKFSKIQIFHEATQQKLAIKKFIAQEENLSSQDVDVRSYALVYWEDQASAINHLIHKEGYLLYFNKASNSSSTTTNTLNSAEWKKAFFILNGEDFSGCRKNNTSPKANTIELILANSILYLVAKNEAEASDWLQCFCKIISLGNYHTDVPSHSCLPCCSVITNSRIYFCHEDLTSGFYRLLESIKLQEINRISFDNFNPFYCVLHDDLDTKSNRYWFIYFIDEYERNEFISNFKKSWEDLFQVSFTVELCKSSEMRKRCIRGVRLIHKIWENFEEADFN